MPPRASRAILAIETSNPSGPGPASGGAVVVGVADAGLALGVRPVALARLGRGARHDEMLMPTIERACARAAVSPGDLARVAVSIGPGGYSSVRIAVATAQVLALATGCACVPVPTAAALALAAPRSARRFAIALAGKRDSAWVTIYDRSSGPAADPPGALLDAGGLAAEHARASIDLLIGDEHLPAPLHDWAASARVSVRAPRFSALRVLAASIGREPVDASLLLPLYPREPEAVALWRARA